MVRDPVGRDAGGRSRDAIAVARAAALRLELGVVVRGDPDEDPDGRTGQSLGGLAAVFERLPRHLEEHPMLGVDEDCLAGRNAEEVGVEAVDDSAGIPCAGECPGRSSPARLPARGRDRADPLDAVAQQLQNAAGASAPGNRQPMPMIAIGSRPWHDPWLGRFARRRAADRHPRGNAPARRSWDSHRRASAVSLRPSHSSSSAASRTAWSEPMPKPASGLRDVDLVGPDAERAGDLRGQPGRDRVTGGRAGGRPSLGIVR